MQIGQSELHKGPCEVVQALSQLQRRRQRHGRPRIDRKSQHAISVLVGDVDIPVAVVTDAVTMIESRIVLSLCDHFDEVALVGSCGVFLGVDALTEDQQPARCVGKNGAEWSGVE